MQPLNAAFPLKQTVYGILLCFCTPAFAAQQNPPQTAAYSQEWLPVYPQVSVNGRVSDGLFPFMSDNGRIFVQTDTLYALGINVPQAILQQADTRQKSLNTDTETITTNEPPLSAVPSETPAEEAATPAASEPIQTAYEPTVSENHTESGNTQIWTDLSSITGLDIEYNAAEQTLALTAPLDWLNLPTTVIGQKPERAYDIAKPGFAGILNYDANITRNSSGGSTQGILAEARFTTPAGYLSHQHIWSRTRFSAERIKSQNRNVRLDTFWRSVWPEQGLIMTAGDLITGQTGISGSARIGGFKLEHSYRTQPWRNTSPLRAYVGESTLPGTVDLYLNGVRQYSQDVAAGEYEITLPPSISGRGNAQVVATDMLGRTVVVDMPLYGGSDMLAKGLNEWSLEAGYLRKNYGLKSFDYDKQLVGSGTLRYGLTNFVTTQLHAEGGGGYRRFGIEANTVLGSLGQLNLSHAQSFFKQHKGKQSSIFFSTQYGNWTFGSGWSSTDDAFTGFNALLAPAGYHPEAFKRRTASVSVGWHSKSLGSFNLSYLRLKSDRDQTDKTGTLNWSRNIGRRASVFMSASKYSGNHNTYHSIYGGLSISFDRGYSASVSARHESGRENSYRVALNKSGSGVGSTSWNIGWEQQNNANGRNRGRLNGFVRHETQYGDAHAAIYHTPQSTNWDAGWRGGLVWMKGGLFPTRNVYDSFAVVSTAGLAGIPVSLSNNHVGKTNSSGLLLVPNLSAYQKNMIGIDTTDLPQDIRVERARIQAVPSERSGMAVDFKLKRMQAASMILKDENGQVLPANSTVFHADDTPIAVVGFDGQTFIEHLVSGNNTFEVSLPEEGGICRFNIDYQAKSHLGSLPDLGEILCIRQ
ncbi:fimbria/pilus outer membrane usher protein [Neisseria montereyensis]|uniref:Fimbria/pilus outer membrane usher protein n=1 Tax=Neisseria montereyensis TaxID=2973938 RepID=A0ABT2F9P5_9NEIS|nr:fimbria/pilus outer membrane usher protein [Neisseria montereyensis]MCS4532918.1 fimbria/pilus outer membrane usher protein [Neisseria montereyensis]